MILCLSLYNLTKQKDILHKNLITFCAILLVTKVLQRYYKTVTNGYKLVTAPTPPDPSKPLECFMLVVPVYTRVKELRNELCLGAASGATLGAAFRVIFGAAFRIIFGATFGELRLEAINAAVNQYNYKLILDFRSLNPLKNILTISRTYVII